VQGSQVNSNVVMGLKSGFNGLNDVMALLSWVEVGLTSEAM